MIIDIETPSKNPARVGAWFYAQRRANRENRSMNVFVSPPLAPGNTLRGEPAEGCNVWYVRSTYEAPPADSFLVAIIQPNKT